MKIFIRFAFLFFVLCQIACATDLDFPEKLDCGKLPFLERSNALALNVPYEPILDLRTQIGTALERELKFFTGWDSRGEAHVTVITPPEYTVLRKKKLSLDEINEIARANAIQDADLVLYGLGSGKKKVSGIDEETFFMIVDSNKLRHIRTEIWKAYVRKGGNPKDWDPAWFFPHITVGFTWEDIHEPDVLKNIKHSYDPRFRLKLNTDFRKVD